MVGDEDLAAEPSVTTSPKLARAAPMAMSFARWLHGIEKKIDAIKTRWRDERGRDEPIWVLPFRGYAADGTVHLKGRVLEKEHERAEAGDSFWRNVARTFRRYESDEIAGARIVARYDGLELESWSDEEGYFELEFDIDAPESSARELWYRVELELLDPPEASDHEPRRATAEFIYPGESSDFAVVHVDGG